ncbi:DUF3182 family protein [Stenotrophomonas sp. MH1]|uniref:DUF3182 family protein n=1 Tax=Stenotrophomonas capsici TaxID=3110230 RepID=A0ABU5V545_9GAMM|nr:DUF3182 family protein [Stenotrophomonas sp. MH1]MEA5668471.1 DUF3182 family protein [Stenotrophomonas sp. MH1]
MQKLSLIFDSSADCAPHEVAALRFAAARLAALLRLDYDAAETSPGVNGQGYRIPMSTLSFVQADALRISDESHLWGGIVPHAFVATKLVSHPLWSAGAARPEGWRAIDGIEALTLPGYSVFSREDAWAAGCALLQAGQVRVKSPFARGGNGQVVVGDEEALRRWLAALMDEPVRAGLVLERNLAESSTCSVGSSCLPGHEIAYRGSQCTVAGPGGHDVYGGSTLEVHRGTLKTLRTAFPDESVCMAEAYDTKVRGAYDVLASRRNYDVIAGVDSQGIRHAGVLEQSWRFGGASMAELLALEWFQQHPQDDVVSAETVESYGEGILPAGAVVYAEGGAGMPRKYARVLPHGY